MPPFRYKFIHNTNHNTTQSTPHRRVRFDDHENAPPANPMTTLDQNARNVMDAAVSDKTRQRKLQYAAEFLVWAANHGLTEEDVLPPSENTLCNFAASFAGKLAGGTAKAKGEIICGTSSMASNVELPASSFRDQRPPVKKEHLSTLFDELDLSGSCGLDHAMAAVSTGCFYGQLRGGEILPQSSDPADFNPSELPTVKDLKAPTRTVTGSSSSRKPRLNSREARKSSTPLSLVAPSPTRAWRERIRCNAVWSRHNIPRMTGHCFRIGGTTHYLVQGEIPNIVKMLVDGSRTLFSSTGET
ncbi:hypothetical protein BT96DRAFT_1003314 [Gymnopus androsaceus JB14]|uniref:Uncharacterized protein n=1 Tax=Gymnopus androsaceus JB14 TaxID=1447944 RepID=A0A6A4GW85_9AGAR|nr:hypothetical protein BT96DRAFT_1003314 [Gymnopus androsaceus JB14]